MKVSMKSEGEKLTAYVEGRIDTTTAPQLESELKNETEKANSLVLNLEKTDYISSAGLRVILALQKQMQKKGGLVVRNVADDLMHIFEVTGFTDILTIDNDTE